MKCSLNHVSEENMMWVSQIITSPIFLQQFHPSLHFCSTELFQTSWSNRIFRRHIWSWGNCSLMLAKKPSWKGAIKSYICTVLGNKYIKLNMKKSSSGSASYETWHIKQPVVINLVRPFGKYIANMLWSSLLKKETNGSS